jgi:Na+-transporting NADH:ubiquinone oxidoreductase subunit C
MALNKDSKVYTLAIALAICLAGSVLVSTAAVVLKPRQQANQAQDRQVNILKVAGLYEPGIDVGAVFEARVEPKVIEFATGEEAADIDPVSFDPAKYETSLSSAEDIAGINSMPRYGLVYLVRDEAGEVSRYVLPVHGYGLWSTMYAFLALEADGNTVSSISYYQHAETPGLGGEVENPRWTSQWTGKEIYDDAGKVVFSLVKGGAGAGNEHGVDALAGATLTSNGVTNTIRFWLSDAGYKPFLEKATRS